MSDPIPITILTGFLGSGKTTLLLNLLNQLPTPAPKVVLLKNELGALPVDSSLLSSPLAGTKELLNGCLCCSLVGSMEDALKELLEGYKPDRIVIETSGQALPGKLVLEVKRLAQGVFEGKIVVESVVNVVDVENFTGYPDVGPAAKSQAAFVDLVVLGKWEDVPERRLEDVRDKVSELMREDVPFVKSEKGWVDVELIFGFVGKGEMPVEGPHHEHHQGAIEVLDVRIGKSEEGDVRPWVEKLMKLAPKDEAFRIKGYFFTKEDKRAVVNWAFGRWHIEELDRSVGEWKDEEGLEGRLTFMVGKSDAARWRFRLQKGNMKPQNIPLDIKIMA